MKWGIAFICAYLLSGLSFADTSTSSFRTPTGQTVTIGDQVQDMQKKINLSPTSMVSKPLGTAPDSPMETVYIYEIQNFRYTIRTVNNQIQSITWFNLDTDPASYTQSVQ